MRGLIHHLVERQASGSPPRIRPLAPLAMPEADVLALTPTPDTALGAAPAPHVPHEASAASRSVPTHPPAPLRSPPRAELLPPPPPLRRGETPRSAEPEDRRSHGAPSPGAPFLLEPLPPPAVAKPLMRSGPAEDSPAAGARSVSDPGIARIGRAVSVPASLGGNAVGDPHAPSPAGDPPRARRPLDEAPAAEPPRVRPRLPGPVPDHSFLPAFKGANPQSLQRRGREADPAGEPETTVQVTIGRIEIQSPPLRPATKPRPAPRRPALSLGDYLARRGGER